MCMYVCRNAQLAVVHGAVLFGLDPGVFVSFVSPGYYGVLVTMTAAEWKKMYGKAPDMKYCDRRSYNEPVVELFKPLKVGGEVIRPGAPGRALLGCEGSVRACDGLLHSQNSLIAALALLPDRQSCKEHSAGIAHVFVCCSPVVCLVLRRQARG